VTSDFLCASLQFDLLSGSPYAEQNPSRRNSPARSIGLNRTALRVRRTQTGNGADSRPISYRDCIAVRGAGEGACDRKAGWHLWGGGDRPSEAVGDAAFQKDKRNEGAQLEAIPDDEERLVVATGRYIGEGFDDARLDTLFLALPISWKGTLVQYTGRLHRPHAGKTEVQIFDYVDRAVPVLLKMFERRLRAYRAIGYVQGQMADEPTAPSGDRRDELEPLLPGMPDQRG